MNAAGYNAPWGHYSANEARAWVEELRGLPADANYQHWMFQHPDGRRWIGYRAGTFIADKAISRSKTSAAELVETPWEDVLAQSGL